MTPYVRSATMTPRVAVSPDDRARINAIVVDNALRIAVVDCRSGLPVKRAPVDTIKIDGEDHSPDRLISDWDIGTNYLIPYVTSGTNEGLPQRQEGFTAPTSANEGNLSELVKVLNALGYQCGTPTAVFNEGTWAGLERFQQDWYDDHPEEQRPDTYLHRVTTTWIRRILAEYNGLFHEAVKLHLLALGYLKPEDTDSTNAEHEWEAGGSAQEALKSWQKDQFGYKNPWTTFNTNKNLEKRKELATRLKSEYYRTDSHGILRIPISRSKIRAGFELEVAFRDFAVLREPWDDHPSSRWRASNRPGATGFRIEWHPSQDVTTGAWGWRLRPPGVDDDVAELPEFRAALVLEFEASSARTWKEMPEAARKKAGFSPFHEEPGARAEVAVFALVWCQPMWDSYEDPTEPYRTNKKVYVGDGASRGLNMHLCTRYLGPSLSVRYSGKGYGKFEHVQSPKWRTKRSGASKGDHPGLDMHALVGDKVFAVHSGRLTRVANSRKGGNIVKISKIPGPRERLDYLHLSKFDDAAPTKSWVRAGQIVGEAGRTGNLNNQPNDQPSGRPTHTHLNTGGDGYQIALRASDPANQICIPSNATPLVFPCHTEVTLQIENPSNCNFEKRFAHTCWAVGELCCPYMPSEPELLAMELGLCEPDWHEHPDVRTAFASMLAALAPGQGANRYMRRVQAQLRKVWEDHSGAENPYGDPGLPDGDLGALPGRCVIKNGTRLRTGPKLDDSTKFDPDCVTEDAVKGKIIDKDAGFYQIELDDGSVVFVDSSRVTETLSSKSRKAIRAFREQIVREANQGCPEEEQAPLPAEPGCYEMTLADLIELGRRARVVPPEPD